MYEQTNKQVMNKEAISAVEVDAISMHNNERRNFKHQSIERKRCNKEKFNTVSEMRRHLNAFKVLYQAGYNQHSLEIIGIEFENSVEYAMKEISDMNFEMRRLLNE